MTYLLAHSVALVTTLSLSLVLVLVQLVIQISQLPGQFYLPVETNTEHSVVPQSRHEQVLVLPAFTEDGEGTVRQRDLAHPAPVPVSQGLRGAVSSPQPGPLGQDELQLRRGSARDEGADESERVLVEVSLGGKY